MLKFSSCIEILYGEADFYDRLELAKKTGLPAVEFWSWENKDIGLIKEKKDQFNLDIAAMCVGTKNPDYAGTFNAKRLLYRDHDAIDAFVSAVNESIAVADSLDCKTLIITVGQERNDVTRYEQHANIVLCLKAAAPILEDAGITIVIEPLNTLCNHRGYFLPSSYETFEICDEVNSPNIKVLYDIYHQQITEGNIIPTITKHIEQIGHFHLADVPGRHEPGTGELNYHNIFKAIEATGYDHFVGFEYLPTKPTDETVKYIFEISK